MRGWIVLGLTVVGVALSASSAVASTSYYEALSVSDPGNSDGVWGLFVTPGGTVVSNSDLDAEVGTTYSFVWSNGVLSSPTDDLNCWSSCDTEATAINANGQLSGFTDQSGVDQAFREDESTRAITLLRSNSEAYAINAAGQMVGGYRNSSGQERAFLWNGTTFKDLGTLGGAQAVATATAATGQAVGCAQTATGAWHPFNYQNGTMHDLGLPPGLSQACAYSSDQNGEIIGGDDVGPWGFSFPFNTYAGPTVGVGACHAWYRASSGTYTTLSPPGSTCTRASHVALNGQVIGTYTSNRLHPYTWQSGVYRTITPANVPFDHYITTNPSYGNGPLTVVEDGWGNNLYGQLAVTAYSSIPTWALLLTPITVNDEQSPAIGYSGSWNRIAWSGAFGGFVNESQASGATATLPFTGKSLSVIGPVGSGLGSADIYLDGSLVANISENKTNSANRKRVFQLTWPTAGQHTLKIVATSSQFELDAITVAAH